MSPFRRYIVLIIVLLIHAGTYAQSRSLKVEIENVRNDKGIVRVSLYRSYKGFPEEFEKAAMFKSEPARPGIMSFSFDSLAVGEIAIAVLHDENENEKLDKNFLGMPREGYGVSNDARRALGPPRFEQSKFMWDDRSDQMTIKLHY